MERRPHKGMRFLRPFFLGIVIASAFYWFTTHHQGTNPVGEIISRPTHIELSEAAGPEKLDADEQNNIEVYHRVIPSVVNITSKTMAYDFFFGPVPQEGQGSGFIIDKEGHILTNYHVVGDSSQLDVTLHNKKTYRATVIGRDRAHDLAVIQIKAPDVVPVTLGESKNLQVGQKVFAIGNPFGLSGTMTRGIISSMRPIRSPEGAFIEEAIQTDAAINPGNSGGPLLNSHGEVIGINSMIATGGSNQSAGIGFAIPINTAKAVLSDLITLGTVRRPSLGIVSLPIGPELAQEIGLPANYGVLIIQALHGGAAEKAGLKGGSERAYLGATPIMIGGDLIVAIDNDPIGDLQDLANTMNKHRSGDRVFVTIYRGTRKMNVPVILGEERAKS
jgi:S1-C subfamily serine protease